MIYVSKTAQSVSLKRPSDRKPHEPATWHFIVVQTRDMPRQLGERAKTELSFAAAVPKKRGRSTFLQDRFGVDRDLDHVADDDPTFV
jgi:hypothetical protein